MGWTALGAVMVGGIVVGAVTGILSGFGVGGGSLLILWLTIVGGVEQLTASGINLLYFLCCAPPALVSHFRNRLIVREALLWCALSGCLLSPLASYCATIISSSLLRRAFGVLLLILGTKELFHRKSQNPDKKIIE
ncbi:MAG: TSUP family transporter [Butyricicoccus sp.]